MENDDEPDEVCYNSRYSLETGEWVGNYYETKNDVHHFSEKSFILWREKRSEERRVGKEC